jgi:hypothetical protein
MSEQAVARLALRLVRRAGLWVHQGCGCDFGSRGERSNAKGKCSTDRMVERLLKITKTRPTR